MRRQYTIIQHKSADELSKDVRDLLENDGELYGYPFSHEGFFCQAMLTTGFCQWRVHNKLEDRNLSTWAISCANKIFDFPLLDDPRKIYNKTCPICDRVIKI